MEAKGNVAMTFLLLVFHFAQGKDLLIKTIEGTSPNSSIITTNATDSVSQKLTAKNGVLSSVTDDRNALNGKKTSIGIKTVDNNKKPHLEDTLVERSLDGIENSVVPQRKENNRNIVDNLNQPVDQYDISSMKKIVKNIIENEKRLEKNHAINEHTIVDYYMDIANEDEDYGKHVIDKRHWDDPYYKNQRIDYYDFNFDIKVADRVGNDDGHNEAPTTTDISCWVCNSSEDTSACKLTRCDSVLLYNENQNSPKGFSCMHYYSDLNSGFLSPKTQIAKCSHAESSFYDPCEELVKTEHLDATNCRLCETDGCNPITSGTVLSKWLFLLTLLLTLCGCCCFLYFCTDQCQKCVPCDCLQMPPCKEEEPYEDCAPMDDLSHSRRSAMSQGSCGGGDRLSSRI